MQRREFLTLLGGAAANTSSAWPLAARTQQRQMPVVGWLSSRSAAVDALLMAGFRQALNAHGFVEGRNVIIEYRNADLQFDRLPALAADLVRRQASVVVVVGDPSQGLRAAQEASATIPIVAVLGPDPVKDGFAASINRPGGNITGVIPFLALVAQKRLGLLHDLLPNARTIAVLVNPTASGAAEETVDVQAAARVLGLQTKIVNAATEADIYAAFASLSEMKPDALFITGSTLSVTFTDRIVALATHLGLPTSHYRREFVVAGGLMSYASTTDEVYRVLGDYAGRILKGAKAGDLPIQQPTKLELVLNLKTARALGLTVPTSMLLLTDEVIE